MAVLCERRHQAQACHHALNDLDIPPTIQPDSPEDSLHRCGHDFRRHPRALGRVLEDEAIEAELVAEAVEVGVAGDALDDGAEGGLGSPRLEPVGGESGVHDFVAEDCEAGVAVAGEAALDVSVASAGPEDEAAGAAGGGEGIPGEGGVSEGVADDGGFEFGEFGGGHIGGVAGDGEGCGHRYMGWWRALVEYNCGEVFMSLSDCSGAKLDERR